MSDDGDDDIITNNEYEKLVGRRPLLKSLWIGATTGTAIVLPSLTMMPTAAVSASAVEEQQGGGKIISNNNNKDNVPPSFVQEYSDFTESPYGWRYRDVKEGSKDSTITAEKGDRVVFDWSGYTIGYYGRPFQAKGGPQGGAFETKDIDYLRTIVGSGAMIPALEQALSYGNMKPGGVRQVIVPYVEGLTYPFKDDSSHERVGPKPATFSGMRALNFVLDNPRVDRTLLFNIKIIRIDKSNGKGGFLRGEKG
eukprot:CAMPEP_0194147070 /NCGR_PEP_ID=MMETSP0152-20130528/22504_1 /TAXON_ID=1049557 /ORGANISM="Thalassiothrix antarctica, Strain L6-D1" /LENGTH=251 /DNA_ID=CAMNT_0038847759 /DNA_START=285 /DNA_END=1040 /DNA_ORIENTATION=+